MDNTVTSSFRSVVPSPDGDFNSEVPLHMFSVCGSSLTGSSVPQEYPGRTELVVMLPHQQLRPKVKTLFTNESWNSNKMFLCMCKALSFLRKSNLCWPFLYRFTVTYHPIFIWHRLLNPDIYKNAQFLYFAVDVDRVGRMYLYKIIDQHGALYNI